MCSLNCFICFYHDVERYLSKSQVPSTKRDQSTAVPQVGERAMRLPALLLAVLPARRLFLPALRPPAAPRPQRSAPPVLRANEFDTKLDLTPG